MIQRIEVKLNVEDSRGEVLKKKLNEELNGLIKSVKVSDVYTLEKSITAEQFDKIKDVFSNDIAEIASHAHDEGKFDFALEIGFLPGVTDNVGNTASQVLKDTLDIDCTVYSSKLYYLTGDLEEKDIHKIASYLSNKLIQRNHIKSYAKFIDERGMDVIIPKVNLGSQGEVDVVEIINAKDDELIELGKKGILDLRTGERRGPLALDLDSMKTIRDYFKNTKERNPTDIELESLAQTWSEHCKHTIFASKIDDVQEGLYKGYIKKATNEVRKALGQEDLCVSVFTDNSGVIVFDDDYLITDKAETHNSPSALDPFGGAITGIVGVNRDTIGCGMGAMPIINGYGFCIADPRTNPELYRGKDKTNPALTPLKIMNGIVDGVNVGGNCSGIPTVQGFMNFHENFSGKPLVFVRTVGLLPKTVKGSDSTKKQAQPGDFIVVIGGRVGKDGIHGATFSSEAMDSGSPATAVQIGDPITQKKLSDVIVKEARDLGLYNSITDNGAGGISCSVAEMARECGGCEVDLDKVPLKYPGMDAWEIWISESQERMTLSVPQEKWDKFKELMEKRGVEAKVIGNFTNSGSCIVKQEGKVIMDIELDFLHNGLPEKSIQTTFTKKHFEEPKLEDISVKESMQDMIGRLNICSTEFVARQYDHEVGGGSVLKPIAGKGEVINEASLVRPVLNSKKAVGVSQALYPRYGDIDTYHMASCAIDTAIKNLVCCGIPLKKIALMDNFCWCSSDEKERLGQLKRSVKACYDYATEYLAPFISGKDSMFNDFKGFNAKNEPIKISVPPTLLISSIGIMNDYEKSISPEVKFAGDLVYVLGKTKNELGGSEFYSYVGEKVRGKSYVGNKVPEVDAETNKEVYNKLTQAIGSGFIASAIPVNLGGLGIAFAKTALGGNLGLDIDLKKIPAEETLGDLEILYSQSCGRIVVTINPKDREEFESIMSGIPFANVGQVCQDKNLVLKGTEETNLNLEELDKKYKETLAGY